MRFGYLNLKNHPRGNIILQSLLKSGLIPSIIIEENSTLAAKNYNSIASYFDKNIFANTSDIIRNYNIPLIEVKNHNDLDCENILKEQKLDLIVLGDTRIIKNNIMSLPEIGIINSHPGYLPDVRGNNPYIWALIHDLPQGCSVHFIDENIDTGDLILREEIEIKNFKSYPALLNKINDLCAKLIVEAVRKISTGDYERMSQRMIRLIKPSHEIREFLAAPDDIKKQAIKKLASIF